MDNIVLIGFMGSGKSTIAALLAQRLKKEWIDSDTYIESQEKLTIPKIFALQGEQHFRSLEKQFIQSFQNTQDYVIATGGGMPIFNDIKNLGTCFYLQSSFEVITQRITQSLNITGHNRPLFHDRNKAKQLYMQREPLYIQASDIIINADSQPEEIIHSIMEALHDKTQ